MSETQTFSRQALRTAERHFLDAGDEKMADLVYEAMMDINTAEDNARTYAQRLRDRADEVDRYLAGHFYMDQVSGVAGIGEDLNRAIAKRQMAYKTLARLLTAEEIKALTETGAFPPAPAAEAAEAGETR